MSFVNYFNKQKSLFDNINNKIKKYKKTFWLFEKLKAPVNKGKFFNKEQLSGFFISLFIFIFGLIILTLGVFISFFNTYDLLSSLLLVSIFFILSLPVFFIGLSIFYDVFFISRFSVNKFSKKEILILEKHGTKNINNINNILKFTLKRTKLKKDEFSDIIDIYNTYQSQINNGLMFKYIKEKLITMYSKKEISKNELKTYTKHFIDNLNIESKTIIRDSYLDIEKNTFNENENLFNKENSIVF